MNKIWGIHTWILSFIPQLLVGLCLLTISLTACRPSDKQRVLVIHSYEKSYAGYPQYDQLIADEFSKAHLPVEISTFYLNCEHYNEEAEIRRISRLLDSVSCFPPDIILVNEDQATYSLLKTSHQLLKNTPVVFAGVNYPDRELLSQYPKVTGLHDKMDFCKNLEMINKVTGKYNIFTVLDYTFIDRKIRTDIDEQLSASSFKSNLDWHLNKEALKKELKNKNIVFSALSMRKPSLNWTDKLSQGADFLWAISKYSALPYLQTKIDYTTVTIASFSTKKRFTTINELFDCGYNFLGGYMTPLPVQVREEVGIAVRILRGEDVSSIPVSESSKGYYMDWKVMKKEGIKLTDVPAEYIVINTPFKVRFPILWWLIIMGSILSFLTLVSWLTFLYLREARRKRVAQYDLEDERESLALAIEGSDTYAWRIRKDRMEFEGAFWKSLQLEARALSMNEFLSFVHPDYQQAAASFLVSIAVKGKHFIELKCSFNGNEHQWWELRSSTMESMSREQKTTGLFLNIEEYKRREQELTEARELAEKAELKESFLANMSHEIRTPLNAIVGFSNLLATPGMELSPEEKEQFIESINHNNELLLKLINDILEISRIESGYMPFSYNDCMVASLVRESYQTHCLLMPEQINFQVEEGEDNLTVYVDRDRLKQVLTNFLNNASKFTKEGTIKIGWKYNAPKEEVEIYVEDTGIGISKAEQKMIFSRFYKQNEFVQGTGLGLSICKVIVKKLRGRLSLWSEPGVGSRFSIFFSCKKNPGNENMLS